MTRGTRGTGAKNKNVFEECNIKKAILTANTDGFEADLRKASVLEYQESMFSDTIDVSLIITSSSSGVRGKNLMEGLPLVGTEDFNLAIEDANGNVIESELVVNKVTPIESTTQKESIMLEFTSEQFIRNEERSSAVTKRYDGKISENMRKILIDNLKVDEDKIDIEETNNNYNFIGNTRKPFYILNWLCKKSIPSKDGKRGESAGYIFFQNADGFHCVSIDKLFSQDHSRDGGGAGSYIQAGQPDTPLGYDGRIINLTADNRFIANQKLRMGAYKTRLVIFDPFNCKYDVIEQDAYDTEEGTTHAGKKLPIINKKFAGEATRTTYMLRDTGTLPTGDVEEQVKKNEEESFEVESILNQSIRRYNQFSIGSIEVDIGADFTIRAGQTIFVDTSSSSNEQDQETNKEIGGKYLIAVVKHAIRNGKGITKLGLVRDSVGREGKPHSGSMVN